MVPILSLHRFIPNMFPKHFFSCGISQLCILTRIAWCSGSPRFEYPRLPALCSRWEGRAQSYKHSKSVRVYGMLRVHFSGFYCYYDGVSTVGGAEGVTALSFLCVSLPLIAPWLHTRAVAGRRAPSLHLYRLLVRCTTSFRCAPRGSLL